MPIFPILLGIVAFFCITGGQILWPSNINWLMHGNDTATGFLGWHFFRSSPLLQWPIGANPHFGMDISSSIVYTDSIPLMAFIFKPFNTFLPEIFQYNGLWLMICFMLQAFFAWKLLSLFTKDFVLSLLGSLFFIIAPACLWRLHTHHALLAHWILLAGLYLYFSKSFSAIRWIILLVITTMIHAYLLAMLILIWLADLIQRYWLKRTDAVTTMCYFFIGGLTIAIAMWATGYFMVGGGIVSEGFGFYRLNLLSLINPYDRGLFMWSEVLQSHKGGEGDYEGFNYLGFGMLGLGFLTIYELLQKPAEKYNAKIILPLLTLSIFLFLYAASNHIALGDWELFSYSLGSLQPLANSFRASGRFFWPVYYLIYLGIFYTLFTRNKNNILKILCAIMLLTQIIDSQEAWSYFRKKLAHPPSWESPMNSMVWPELARQYQHIIYVKPDAYTSNWKPLSYFAAMNKMTINTGYFGRVDAMKVHVLREQIKAAIVNHEMDSNSLYIFENDHGELWLLASMQAAPTDLVGTIDGFRIIAPNLKACKNCNIAALTNYFATAQWGFNYNGGSISFDSDGNSHNYRLSGWATPESWGTWSNNDVATVRLDLKEMPVNDLDLLINGQAFLAEKHPSLEVDIIVNDHPIARLKYDQLSNQGLKIITIPKALALERNGQIWITFKFHNPRSPAELGVSSDTRRLGLGIVSLELKARD